MEKKFESELGKRIVEGNQRKSSRKVILGIAAISACALLFGAASFSFAMGATVSGPPFIIENVLFDHEVSDLVDVETGDADVKRVMSLKYRTTDPPGGIDPGNTKFIYVINLALNSTDEYTLVGMPVGNLELAFTTYEGVNAEITTEITVVSNAGGVSETMWANTTEYMLAESGLDLTATIPAVTLDSGLAWVPTPGDTVSIVITAHIGVPNLTGFATETAFPGLDYAPMTAAFPVVAAPEF
jgi:hypothetical protein